MTITENQQAHDDRETQHSVALAVTDYLFATERGRATLVEDARKALRRPTTGWDRLYYNAILGMTRHPFKSTGA